MLGAGLKGLTGVGPEVGKHLYSIFVSPQLVHGLESLILTAPDNVKLEDFFKANLRYIQHFPKCTAIPALYLLMGVPPVEATIHIRTITFFASALRRPNSVEYKVIERQLTMKSSSSHSWVWYVNGLLKQYRLPSGFSLLEYTPEKERWKRIVKAAVLNKWERDLKEHAESKSTLSLLNLDICNLSHVHPVWRLGSANSLTVLKATTKAKLLVQRYPLFYNRISWINYGKPCPLCKSEAETLSHFLLECASLRTTRQPFMPKIRDLIAAAGIHTPVDMIRLILDPSNYMPDPLLDLAEETTRDLCFALHQTRSSSLGYFQCYRHHRDNILHC